MNVSTTNACILEDCLAFTPKGEGREVWLPVPGYEGYYMTALGDTPIERLARMQQVDKALEAQP